MTSLATIILLTSSRNDCHLLCGCASDLLELVPVVSTWSPLLRMNWLVALQNILPSSSHFYLQGADCTPNYSEALVSAAYREDIKSASKTIKEWKALFAGYVELQTKAPGNTEEAQAYDRILLKMPKKFREPSLDFWAIIVPPELDEIVVQGEMPNYHWWDEDKDASLLPSGNFHFLRQLCSFVAK